MQSEPLRPEVQWRVAHQVEHDRNRDKHRNNPQASMHRFWVRRFSTTRMSDTDKSWAEEG